MKSPRTFLALSLAALAAVPAHADSPPMPPCPPGWNQQGRFGCSKPFECPVGWRLDAGPKCVPWECKEDKDCGWKGNVPCVAADLCFEPGGDRAIRVCESAGAASRCPSALSCRAGKLCGAPGIGGAGGNKFENWSPSGASTTNAGAPSAATASSAPPVSASASASDRPSTTGPAAETQPVAPRKAGCGSCGVGRAPTARSSALAAAAVAFGAALAFVRRRARR